MTSFNKIYMFSKDDYDGWKICMQEHLSAQDDDMWYVITDGPMNIMKANTVVVVTEGAPQMIEKPRAEWTTEDTKKQIWTMWNEAFYTKPWIKIYLARSKLAPQKKKIWEKLTQLCEGNDQKKEKTYGGNPEFDSIKMKPGETMNEFDERFIGIMIELNALDKSYSNREVALKLMRALPRE
ncbi:uncharacterized protein [Henckelia pumila]|uniref:uncharacterized protein n=1 Tax=Henckelia pumila TaxID=405737 RepID=UPI003C6DF794